MTSELFKSEEPTFTPLQRALNLFKALGVEENIIWVQTSSHYMSYKLKALITECMRTKCPALEYLTLAACIAMKSELSFAHILLQRIKSDTSYVARGRRDKRRAELAMLRASLEAALAKIFNN